MQKPNVFLSSALHGLEDLRSILIDLFENEKGYFPIYYGERCSGGLTGKPGIVEQCLEGVRSSNAFVLIVDKRYGEPDQKDNEGNSISITELEYLEAVKNKLAIYVFCRNEVWIVHKFWETNPDMNFKADSRYDHPIELMKFLSRLKEGNYYIPKFDTAADLRKDIIKIELSVETLKYQPSVVNESESLEESS